MGPAAGNGGSVGVPPGAWAGGSEVDEAEGGGERDRTRTGERSGGVEADLDGCGEEGFEFVRGRQGVSAEGFEEVGSKVAEGAEAGLDVPLAADAALEELDEEVGDLEEEVEVLGRSRVFGVGVFHRVAAVLLDVEAFILGAPALSSSQHYNAGFPWPRMRNPERR